MRYPGETERNSPGALHSSHVLRVGHHADGGLVPLAAGADGAGAVPVRQFLADRAAVDRRLGTYNRLGEGVGLIIRHGQDIPGRPLGGFDAHAGQLGELLHQIFQSGASGKLTNTL